MTTKNSTTVYTPAQMIDLLAEKLEGVMPRVAQYSVDFEQLDTQGRHIARVDDVLSFYHGVRTAYERLDEARKEIGKTLEGLSRYVIPAHMKEAGLSSITSAELGVRFTVSDKLSVTIPAEHKQGAYEWLKSNGLSALVVETVNASTISAVARDLLKNQGESLPPELFNTHVMNTTSMTKVKSKD